MRRSIELLGKMPHEITHKSTAKALGFIRIMWRGMAYCVWHSGPSRRGWEGTKVLWELWKWRALSPDSGFRPGFDSSMWPRRQLRGGQWGSCSPWQNERNKNRNGGWVRREPSLRPQSARGELALKPGLECFSQTQAALFSGNAPFHKGTGSMQKPSQRLGDRTTQLQVPILFSVLSFVLGYCAYPRLCTGLWDIPFN